MFLVPGPTLRPCKCPLGLKEHIAWDREKQGWTELSTQPKIEQDFPFLLCTAPPSAAILFCLLLIKASVRNHKWTHSSTTPLKANRNGESFSLLLPCFIFAKLVSVEYYVWPHSLMTLRLFYLWRKVFTITTIILQSYINLWMSGADGTIICVCYAVQ